MATMIKRNVKMANKELLFQSLEGKKIENWTLSVALKSQ